MWTTYTAGLLQDTRAKSNRGIYWGCKCKSISVRVKLSLSDAEAADILRAFSLDHRNRRLNKRE